MDMLTRGCWRAAWVVAGLAVALAALDAGASSSAAPHRTGRPMALPVVELAPRARVALDLVAVLGRAPVEVIETGPSLIATLEDRLLVVDAIRGARGSSHVVVSTADGGIARLEVAFATAQWAVLDGRPYAATFVPVDDPVAATEAWARVDDVVYGTLIDDGARAGSPSRPRTAASVRWRRLPGTSFEDSTFDHVDGPG